MPKCDFCGEEFEEETKLHLHWREHEEELNSHQRDKLKKAERREKERKEAKMRKRKKMAGWGLAGITGLAVVVLLGMQIFSGGSSQTADFQLDKQPMLGNESAPVTVVEFGDFYCPACQNWHFQVKPRLEENYIDTGEAKLYWIDFPLSIHEPQASSAARAAECVYRQDEKQFWNYNDALFQNQRNFDYNVEGFMNLANQSTSGLDYGQLRQCISSRDTSQSVSTDKRIARQNSVTSTPTIYVNGESVGNNYASIKAAIDRNLP